MSSAAEIFDPYREWLGIEPSELPADHYRLLGLSRFEMDAGKIAAAADGRMALIRSNQTGPRGAYTHRLLNEITAAKLCLLSPVAKAQYDQFLRARVKASDMGSVPAPFIPKAVPLSALPPANSRFPGSGAPPRALPVAVPLAPPKQICKSELAIDLDKPPSEEEPPRPGSRLRAMTLMAVAVLLIASGIWGAGKYLFPPGELAEKMDGSDEVPATPHEPPDPAATATVVLQEGSGELSLPPSAAALLGNTKLTIAISEHVLAGWATEKDAAIWEFKLLRPGFFKLELTYAAAADSEDIGIVLLLDDEEPDKLHLQPTGGPEKFATASHTIVVKTSGLHTLTMHPAAAVSEDGLILKNIRLVPVGGKP